MITVKATYGVEEVNVEVKTAETVEEVRTAMEKVFGLPVPKDAQVFVNGKEAMPTTEIPEVDEGEEVEVEFKKKSGDKA